MELLFGIMKERTLIRIIVVERSKKRCRGRGMFGLKLNEKLS